MPQDRIILGTNEVPEVLITLASLLPACAPEDIEAQLQTFDIFVPLVSSSIHHKIAALLTTAASLAQDTIVGKRILAAAQNIYLDPASGRLVDAAQYQTAILKTNASEDKTKSKPGGIGIIERWHSPDGRLIAWLNVRYFRGERDYDYYLAD